MIRMGKMLVRPRFFPNRIICAIRGYLLLIPLSPDNLQELIHRAGLPVDRYVLGDVKLQALDVLLESSHVRIRSRRRCALSGW